MLHEKSTLKAPEKHIHKKASKFSSLEKQSTFLIKLIVSGALWFYHFQDLLISNTSMLSN